MLGGRSVPMHDSFRALLLLGPHERTKKISRSIQSSPWFPLGWKTKIIISWPNGTRQIWSAGQQVWTVNLHSCAATNQTRYLSGGRKSCGCGIHLRTHFRIQGDSCGGSLCHDVHSGIDRRRNQNRPRASIERETAPEGKPLAIGRITLQEAKTKQSRKATVNRCGDMGLICIKEYVYKSQERNAVDF